MKKVLIISATISPPRNVPHLTRTDPEQRRKDYIQAFEFYLNTIGVCFDRLIFAENSQPSLKEFEQIAGRRGRRGQVELVSINGIDHPSEYGKAYGEFKLIDYVHREVCVPETDVVYWKVTGRYVIRNIGRLTSRTDPTIDPLCHSRNYRRRWTEMYLFGYSRQGFEKAIQGLYHRFREDVLRVEPEIFFRALIDDWQKLGVLRTSQRFSETPQIEGFRGSSNNAFGERSNIWKVRARVVANRFLPMLWI